MNFQKEQPPTAFLGGLHPDTVQGDIDKLFAGLNCVEVRLVRDRETDQPRGFGYAIFKDQESLERAVLLTGTEVLGKPVKIDIKRQDNRTPQERNAARNARGGGNNRYDNNNRGNAHYDNNDSRGRNNNNAPTGIPSQPPYKVYVGNLPFEAVEKDLETMFESLSIVKVNLVYDHVTQKHKGYGYAEFSDARSLELALGLDGEVWLGRQLKVNVAPQRDHNNNNNYNNNRNQQPDQYQHSAFANNRRGGGGDQNSSNFRGGNNMGGSRSSYHQQNNQNSTMPPRDQAPFEPPAPTIDDGKARPKLVLAPRSVPDPVAAPAKLEKSNPFGNAKPVDTAAKEREIEKKKQEMAEKEKAAASAAAVAAPPAPTS